MRKYNADEMLVKSDTAHRAKYRLLQSWYRESILKVPPGTSPLRRTEVGNMLPADAVAENPGLNFLDQSITTYVEERSRQIITEGGTIDVDRLRQNMLSSMPLCFNLFGYLRNHKAELAAVLRTVLDLDIQTVDDVIVEWAPRRAEHLNDRTAFDACIRYTMSTGAKGLLAIETKYTEPFSLQEFKNKNYSHVSQKHPEVFTPGAENELGKKSTNQLWRNALLALSIQDVEGVKCHSVTLFSAGDHSAEKSIKEFREHITLSSEFFKEMTLQRFIAECKTFDTLKDWADKFDQRYLDLSPILLGAQG